MSSIPIQANARIADGHIPRTVLLLGRSGSLLERSHLPAAAVQVGEREPGDPSSDSCQCLVTGMHHVTTLTRNQPGPRFSWLEGGWAVDALVGRQTRRHRDLDLAFDAGYEATALEVLGVLGYTLATDWRPVRFELAAPPSRFVDMHRLVLDDEGNGVQAGPDGTTFLYHSTSFTTGMVAGRVTNCISVDLQLRFHSGYDPGEIDRADLERLHRVAARDRRMGWRPGPIWIVLPGGVPVSPPSWGVVASRLRTWLRGAQRPALVSAPTSNARIGCPR